MRHQLIVVVLLLMIAVAACGPAAEPSARPPPTGGEGPITGLADVDSIEILILESFPVQVNVIAGGNLPDGCTTIDEIQKEWTDSTFRVTITTVRSADEVCTQALVPFEETIGLEVYGLQAGTYTVVVNGVTDSFELSVDNVPQEEGTPYP